MTQTTTTPAIFEDYHQAKRALAKVQTEKEAAAWMDQVKATVKDLDGAALLFGFSDHAIEDLWELASFHMDHRTNATPPANRREVAWLNDLAWYEKNNIL